MRRPRFQPAWSGSATSFMWVRPTPHHRSLPFLGLVPFQRDFYQQSKHSYNELIPRASRARVEIEPGKVALTLKHPPFRPWIPMPLTAEGDFADGSPRIWTSEFIDQLLARDNAMFGVRLKTQYLGEYSGLGSWVPVPLEEKQ